MRSDIQEGSVRFANPSCRSRLKLQYSHRVSPPRLLPELRGEWVRKGIGRIEIERMRRGKPVILTERNLQRCALNVRGSLCNSAITPCGVLTHTQAAPDGQVAAWGFSGDARITE